MGSPTVISRTRQLLVEGKDQENFFEAFVRHLKISDDVQIQNFGGVNELSGFLGAFVKMPDFQSVQSIGIVRDAEKSEHGAFQSIQSSLKKANLPVPDTVGTPSAGDPAVAVLVLPGDGNPGMLESVLCRAFNNQEVNRCIADFFECVEALSDEPIRNRDKARAFVYLTTTPNVHHSVGVAAKAGVWDLDHRAFDRVRDFLIALGGELS